MDNLLGRLSCKYSIYGLVVVAVCLLLVDTVSEDPIACWTPAQFTQSHEEYANKVSGKCLDMLFKEMNEKC